MSTPSERTGAVHNDSARESTPRAAEPASFSGSDRMSLYHNYHATVSGSGSEPRALAGAGKDANLPTHLSFDNSIYGNSVYGSGAGVGGDGNYKVASLNDTPAPAGPGNTSARVESQYMKDAGKFAYGDSMNPTEAQNGKDKLQVLTEEAYRTGGEKGVKDLARRMSGQAVDKYGSDAFDKAPEQFGEDVAAAKTTQNRDGSTQVRYDFAQPNSGKTNTVMFQLEKPELGKIQPEYFPDNGRDTYKM